MYAVIRIAIAAFILTWFRWVCYICLCCGLVLIFVVCGILPDIWYNAENWTEMYDI